MNQGNQGHKLSLGQHKPTNHYQHQHIQIVLLRYFILLLPVAMLTLSLQGNQEIIKQHVLYGMKYLDFLLISGLISPCLAQFVLFSQLDATPAISDTSRRQRILAAFFQSLPTIATSASILSALVVALLKNVMNMSISASIAMAILLTLNCGFVAFIGLIDRVKMRAVWGGIWGVYISLFYFAPLIWWLPPFVSIVMSTVALWDMRHPLGRIDFSSMISFAGLRGFFLASIIWLDKIILYVARPQLFNAEYIFISLIPCVLTLNFFYVFIQRKLEHAINTLIWGINNYTISHYLALNKEAVVTLKSSMLHVVIFSLAAHMATFMAASFILPNSQLLMSKLMLGMAVTMMAIMLNIHLYFSANLIFFAAAILFLFATNWFIIAADYYYLTKIGVSIFFMGASFHLLSHDLLKRWKTPHRFILELK